MIKKIIFSLFQLLISSNIWANSCYAVKNGDTLRIGNTRIERAFLWNRGALRTLWICDKSTGKVIKSHFENDDFIISNLPASHGIFSAQQIPSDGVHPACLDATIEYKQGTLSVKRVYRIYPDCPAIACNTWLKGSIFFSDGDSSSDNNADKTNIESQNIHDTVVGQPTLDGFYPGGVHWNCETVEFWDVTDWNNNLVATRHFIPYHKNSYRGNLLFAKNSVSQEGFFMLKEAPCTSTQLYSNGEDFIAEYGNFSIVGMGVRSKDIVTDKWTQLYGVVIGVDDGTDLSSLLSLHNYQKKVRSGKSLADEMIMMNTWGDRNKDAKIDEQFCLHELDYASKLGITVFQIDDGWQMGISPNSATKGGSFKDIWTQKDYWSPNKTKFPHGLTPIVKKANRLGIRLGLWFNPSIQNDFADWEQDANAIIKLYKKYHITIFKIDGVQILDKNAEENLRHLFDKVLLETDHQVIFDLDVTAGRRTGYNMFEEYGNIFMENRYTDWGNYFPYQTLRNLWQLSRYIPAERLQVEFLNKWRNLKKYATDDIYAPRNYSFNYLFSTSMAGQPLAWMEASGLPQEAYDTTSRLIAGYAKVQHDFHNGTILPIGDEPDGISWTGFQSVKDDSDGYFLLYREYGNENVAYVKTWLPRKSHILIKRLLGDGDMGSDIDEAGRVKIALPNKNSFGLFRYHIQK